MTAPFTQGHGDPTVQPVPASVVERVDAADSTLQNPRRAVISLGSNLGNRLETLQGAVDALEDTPGVPGLELPDLDVTAIARGYGCAAHQIDSLGDFREAFRVALRGDGPTVLAVPITRDVAPLL